MTLGVVEAILTLTASALTILLLLRILFFVRAQNKKISEFENRLKNVEHAKTKHLKED